MKIKVLKIMVIFIILIGLIMMNSYNVFAISDPIEINIPDSVKGDEEIEELGEEVLGIVTVIGYAVAIIISILIGIKYMTGSVEEKAGYKKSMMPYIVGCVILVAAPAVTNVVYDMATSMGGAMEESTSTNIGEIVKAPYCFTCEKFIDEESCSCTIPETAGTLYKCTKCKKEPVKGAGGIIKCSTCGAEL